MVLDYDKEYVCKYCGSENVNEYLDEELDYLTFRCENCFHEEDNLKDLLILKEEYGKTEYIEILKVCVKKHLGRISRITNIKNNLIDIKILDYHDEYTHIYVDENNRSFNIDNSMSCSFDSVLLFYIIKTMLRQKFELICNE